MDTDSGDTYSFIMSYLNQILTAATRVGLSQERQASILNELRTFFKRMPEEVLQECFSRLEETRVISDN